MKWGALIQSAEGLKSLRSSTPSEEERFWHLHCSLHSCQNFQTASPPASLTITWANTQGSVSLSFFSLYIYVYTHIHVALELGLHCFPAYRLYQKHQPFLSLQPACLCTRTTTTSSPGLQPTDCSSRALSAHPYVHEVCTHCSLLVLVLWRSLIYHSDII